MKEVELILQELVVVVVEGVVVSFLWHNGVVVYCSVEGGQSRRRDNN